MAWPSGATGTSVTSANGPVQDTTGSFSWKVSYDSTNPAQRDIGDSCHETSGLTTTHGGVRSSPVRQEQTAPEPPAPHATEPSQGRVRGGALPAGHTGVAGRSA